MTKTIISICVPKNNLLAEEEYIQGSIDEEKYSILKEIEITPALDDEGIKKYIERLKALDREKKLKQIWEFFYGIPYEEKYRAAAEKLLENGSFCKKMMGKMSLW